MMADAGASGVHSVAKGVMAIADCLDNQHQLSRNEKVAAIIGAYKAVLDGLGHNRHVDLMAVAGNIHQDALRRKIPELPAAVKYFQRHILQSN